MERRFYREVLLQRSLLQEGPLPALSECLPAFQKGFALQSTEKWLIPYSISVRNYNCQAGSPVLRKAAAAAAAALRLSKKLSESSLRLSEALWPSESLSASVYI